MNAAPAMGDGVTVSAETLIALRHGVEQERAAESASALPGGFAVARRGNGQVIADSRLYMAGDELRHVDRGATARTGELHVRTYHEERDRVRFLVADFRPCMLFGMRRALRSVAAAEALAWLGWSASDVGGRVGLLAITAGNRVHVRSRGRVRGMLEVIGGLVRAQDMALAAATDGLEDPPLDQALSGLARLVPRGAEIVLASALDHAGPGFDALVGEALRHRDVRLLLVGDSGLAHLPSGSYPVALPGGHTSRVRYRGGAPRPRAVPEGCSVAYLDAGTAMPDGLSAEGG